MKVRTATEHDIPALARIRHEGGWDGGAPADRMLGYLRGDHNPQKALPPRIIIVALENEAAIGYIAGHLTRRYDCDAELEWLFVLPEYRRKKVASRMLRELAAWFHEQHAVRVCVNVAPDNAAAVEFYARHGATALNEYFLVWTDISQIANQGQG